MNESINQPTTEQDGVKRDEFGRVLPGAANLNPEGKGGFGENPDLINRGGRPKNQESFSYWLNFFKNMTVAEFKEWEKSNPEETQTVAASLAYARIFGARNSLKEFKEVADRTEGRSPQTIIHEGGFFAADTLTIIEVDDDIETEQEAEIST